MRQCAVRTTRKKKEKKIKTSAKSQSMKWALMCSVRPHRFHSISTSLLEECVLVSESHASPKHSRPCERDDAGQYPGTSYEAKCDCVYRHVRFIFLLPHQGNIQHHAYLLVCLAPTDPFRCRWFCQRGCPETVRE